MAKLLLSDETWALAAEQWSELYEQQPDDFGQVPALLVEQFEVMIRGIGPESAAFVMAYMALLVWAKAKSGEQWPDNWKPGKVQ